MAEDFDVAVRAMQLLSEKAGTQQSLSDMPLGQSFASKSFNQDQITYRDNADELQQLKAQREYARSQGDVDEFNQRYPDLDAALSVYDQADKEIKQLRSLTKDARATEDPAERQQKLLEISRRTRSIQMRANQAYRDVEQRN